MLHLYLLLLLSTSVCCTNWDTLNLHPSHIPYFFNNHLNLKEQCFGDATCPYKDDMNPNLCFGYEQWCNKDKGIKPIDCPDKSKWAKSVHDQKAQFWNHGDFGIVSEKRKEMKTLCFSDDTDGGFMECEGNARYCRGKNVVLDLRKTKPSKQYDTDFIKAGEIGGRCVVNKRVVAGWDKQHRNSLQSWYQVMEHFTELPQKSVDDCDITIDRPVIISQTDAVVNMFHHFCDFINVYVSQHLNSTTFNTDVNVITWDTNGLPYRDPFNLMWRPVSDHPVTTIGTYIGKKICFKDVMFALPPRQRLGLFYNMPLIDGCYGTGLFRAYNDHVMHRLAVQQNGPLKDKVRITILSRKTQYRNILNEQELVDALNNNPKYEARIVTYKFAEQTEDRDENLLKQIQSTYNSDVFIGMHGAGLTHMIFLPHWAAIIELYHCGDVKCYETLARLRGVKYFTWTKMDKMYPEDEGHHPTLGAHEKFTNYSFEVSEFMKLVKRAADHVMKHQEFRSSKRQRYQPTAAKDEL